MRRCALVVLAALLCTAARAHAASVQWEQAETEHFLFVFQPQDRASVDELLTLCEDVYAKVCGFFRSYPKKVPVIVRGRVDLANGSTQFFPEKIELYIPAPTDHFIGARTESWMKILLTHELTHFVHFSMQRGLFSALSVPFGRDVATAAGAFLPGWMIEGPSTELETRFTSGGRGRNPLFEMYRKAPVMEGRLFSLEQAGYDSAFPPSGRIYVAGYMLIDYLLSTYGENTFTRIMDIYLRFPFFGPWQAIQKVTGESAERVFADMKRSLAATYGPSAALGAGARVSPKRDGDWTHPQLTAKGLYVVRSAPESFPAIVRLDPATGAERVLTPVSSDPFAFSATADGRTIFLSSLSERWIDAADPVVSSDLYRLDVETGARVQLTRDAHLWQPATSADGGTLLAVQEAGPYSRLVAVDPSRGGVRVLFSRTEGNVYTPCVSPDGKRVAFTFNLRGFQDVYVADLQRLQAGSQEIADPRAAVTDVNAEAALPVMGPDPFGEYFPSFLDDDTLLFSSDREGSLALYRAELDTGRIFKVLSDPVAAITGIAYRDAILYSSYASEGWCLKEKSIAELDSIPVENPSPLPYPQGTEWTGKAVPSRPYLDWPLPSFWLPYASFVQSGPSSTDAAVGAIAYGASLLGNTNWTLDAGWSVASAHPQGDFALSSALGPFLLSARSQLRYGYAGQYADTATSSVTLSLPFLDSVRFDRTVISAASVGISETAEVDSGSPFTFAQAAGGALGSWSNTLSLTGGLSFRAQKSGGALDFNPVPALSAHLQSSTLLPVLDFNGRQETDFLFQAGLSIPSLAPHQVVKLGIKTTYAFAPGQTSYVDDFTVPRGFPDAVARPVAGKALGSIDYLVPALLDSPLVFGVAITGIVVGLHLEAAGEWGFGTAPFAPETALFPGAEAVFLLAYGSYQIPVGIGVAARIDTLYPGSFDARNDLRPYVFLGFDSTGGSMETRGVRSW